MHRMIRRMRARHGPGPAPTSTVVLVHASGVVLSRADGSPVVFPSAAAAELFAERHTCEPLAFRAVPAGPRPAPLEPVAA